MAGVLRHLLVGCLLVQAIQVSLAAMDNVARGKRTTQSSASVTVTGASSNAVDGNYDNTDLSRCAAFRSSSLSSPSHIRWTVHLGGLYAVASITIYNTAVLPEGAFTKDMSVCIQHRSTYNITACRSIQNTDEQHPLPPGGNVTIHFNELLVADVIIIRRDGFLTLCEVDVLGTKVVLNPEENASVGKGTRQSGTVPGRFAHLAADGNIRSTNLSLCASAFNYDLSVILSHAWWQVNLGDFYLVKALKVYFPTAYPDRSYTDYFNSFISLNDSLPWSYGYSGPGSCYYRHNYVGSSGVSILNCNVARLYPRYFLIVGRYVTIMSYDPSSYASVMTVCEVTVTGVRQNISADDPALAVFSPKPNATDLAAATYTTETESSTVSYAAGIESATASYAAGSVNDTAYPVSVAAIVIACVFAILCIVLIVVVIILMLRGRAKNEDAVKPAANAYQGNVPAVQRQRKKHQEAQQPQQELQLQVPEEAVYANSETANNGEMYESISSRPSKNCDPQYTVIGCNTSTAKV